MIDFYVIDKEFDYTSYIGNCYQREVLFDPTTPLYTKVYSGSVRSRQYRLMSGLNNDAKIILSLKAVFFQKVTIDIFSPQLIDELRADGVKV